MSEDNIQVVLTKLEGLKELFELRFDKNDGEHKAVTDHLTKLNGQTEKNTHFRIRGHVYLSMGVFIASAVFTFIMSKVI